MHLRTFNVAIILAIAFKKRGCGEQRPDGAVYLVLRPGCISKQSEYVRPLSGLERVRSETVPLKDVQSLGQPL